MTRAIDVAVEEPEEAGRLFSQALDDLNEAVRLEPQYASAYDNLGNIYAIYGKNEEALRHFDEAIRLRSGANAYLHRGLFKIYNLGRT